MIFKSKLFDQLSLTELYEILHARSSVFALEQKIICCDPDRVDYRSLHCYIEDKGEIVAYLRAFYENDSRELVRIGRVLTTRRGEGYGRLLMEKSIEEIRSRMPCEVIGLHSQTQVRGFYEKLGFSVCSEEFYEAGIPHIEMKKKVNESEKA